MITKYPCFASHIAMKKNGCPHCFVSLEGGNHYKAHYMEGQGQFYIRCYKCDETSWYDVSWYDVSWYDVDSQGDTEKFKKKSKNYPSFSSHSEMKRNGCPRCPTSPTNLVGIPHFESLYRHGKGRFYLRCPSCEEMIFYDVDHRAKLISELKEIKFVSELIRDKADELLTSVLHQEPTKLQKTYLSGVHESLEKIHRQLQSPSKRSLKK